MGVVILAGCIFLYLKTYNFPAAAAMWPRLVLAVLALLAAWVVYRGVSKTRAMRRDEEVKFEGEAERLNFQCIRSPLVTFAGVVAYFFAITIIGFYPATVLFLAVFMWYGGIKDWKAYILTVVGVNVFIYLLFTEQLNVRLPPGLFLQ